MPRVSVVAPAVLVGVPVPEARNPYIAVPVARVIYDIRLERCGKPSLTLDERLSAIKGPLGGFWSSVSEGFDAPYCPRVSVEGLIGDPGPSGLYSSLTASLLHALAREYGDVLEEDELLEYTRLADPFTYDEYPGWEAVLDALRYSVATGGVVAFRDEVEHAKLPGEGARTSYSGAARTAGPRLTRNNLGGELYSALIKLAGLQALEAAIAFREGSSVNDIVERFMPLQEGLALAIWGVRTPERCVPAPSLPGYFEFHCIDGEGGGV